MNDDGGERGEVGAMNGRGNGSAALSITNTR
jgi:hypothetical protein